MHGETRVAVLMGGVSAERDVSLQTGLNVLEALSSSHSCFPLIIEAHGEWNFGGQDREPLELLDGLRELRERADVVFNALHGPWGEDGCVQGLLRTLGMPFTGPDVIPAAVTMDKALTKEVLRGVGLETPRYFLVSGGTVAEARSLAEERGATVPLPWFIKPNRLGSSVGCAQAETIDEFIRWWEDCRAQYFKGTDAAGDSATPRGMEALRPEDFIVEELVDGRELTCAVLSIDESPRALPPIEIRPTSSKFFDYHAKYTAGATEEICPAPLDASDTRAVESLAIRLHELFGCDPLSRTDLIRRNDGSLSILEINTLPGMTRTSLVPLAASKSGLSLESLFAALVDHAFARASRWSNVSCKESP